MRKLPIMSNKILLEKLQDEWQRDCNNLLKEIEEITTQLKCVDEISSNLQAYVSSVVLEVKREPVIENKVKNALKGLTDVQMYVRSETVKRSNMINFKKGQISVINDNIEKVELHKRRSEEEKKRKERILKKINDGVDLSIRPLGERPEKLKDIRNVKSESTLNVNKTIEDS